MEFNHSQGQLQGRLIDFFFFICEFRRQYKGEEKWRCSRAHQDEEGTVGFVMQRYLNKDGFVNKRSEMYENLDGDFMMETEEDLKALTIS